MSEEHRSITMTNVSVSGSNLANGDVQQTIVQNSTVDRIGELRTALGRHRDELVGLAGADGPKVADRLTEIDQELAADEPDRDVVRGGWKSVVKAVGAAGAAAAGLTKITELVRALFGG